MYKYLCTLQAFLSRCGGCGSKEQRAKSQGSPDLHYQIWGSLLSGLPSKLVSVVCGAEQPQGWVCPAVSHGCGVSTLSVYSHTLNDFTPCTSSTCKNFGQVHLTWAHPEVSCTQEWAALALLLSLLLTLLVGVIAVCKWSQVLWTQGMMQSIPGCLLKSKCLGNSITIPSCHWPS